MGRGPVPPLVLVVVGVRPDTSLAVSAGPKLGAKAAIAVDCGPGCPTRRQAVQLERVF